MVGNLWWAIYGGQFMVGNLWWSTYGGQFMEFTDFSPVHKMGLYMYVHGHSLHLEIYMYMYLYKEVEQTNRLEQLDRAITHFKG